MPFQGISESLFSVVLEKANLSERKRANYNFHQYSETYQRFLNVLLKGTYICPHKHINPGKAETFLVLKGKVGFLAFDDRGKVIHQAVLSEDGPCYGIDIQPGVWHTIVCLSDVAVCFEGKTGPYDPNADKTFAVWAPLENEPAAGTYAESLFRRF
jgi:cupin fold WbuC family metalloprotein